MTERNITPQELLTESLEIAEVAARRVRNHDKANAIVELSRILASRLEVYEAIVEHASCPRCHKKLRGWRGKSPSSGRCDGPFHDAYEALREGEEQWVTEAVHASGVGTR